MAETPRPAWIVPALNIGLYQDVVDANTEARKILEKRFMEGLIKAQMARPTQSNYIVRNQSGDLLFSVIDDNNKNRQIFMTASDLMLSAAENSGALFSYQHKPVGKTPVFGLSDLVRSDKEITYGGFYATMQNAKRPVSVNIIRPL